MNIVGSVQSFVLLVLGVGALCLTAFALFDVLRRPAGLFPHAGRLTKPVWLGILVAAFLVAVVSLFAPLGILNIAGVIGAGVYLADMRPKLKQLGGGRGGSSNGPYGPY